MTIKLDTSKADEAMKKQLQRLSSKELVKVGQRAVNRAATAAQTELSRQVRQTVNLRASVVKDAVSVRRASGSTASAQLTVKYKRVALRAYGPRQTQKGISVRVFKEGPLVTIKSGFIVESLNKQAFIRVGNQRLPIKLLTGPSVRSQAEPALPAVNARAAAVMDQRLRYEMNRAITGASK
jgi:hypothetical protein